MSDTSPINHPPHYNAHPSGVECITVVEHMSFNVGNAMKYLWRADEKGAPIQDLEKARWYLDREIQRRKAAEEEPHFETIELKCGHSPYGADACNFSTHIAVSPKPDAIMWSCPECGHGSVWPAAGEERVG